MIKDIILAIAMTESGLNPYAVSPKGALGVMQMMPIGVKEVQRVYPEVPNECPNLYDPCVNLAYGTRLFEYYLKGESYELTPALIAYNGGPSRAKKYRQRLPIPNESRDYPGKVFGNWVEAVAAYGNPESISRGRFDIWWSCSNQLYPKRSNVVWVPEERGGDEASLLRLPPSGSQRTKVDIHEEGQDICPNCYEAEY